MVARRPITPPDQRRRSGRERLLDEAERLVALEGVGRSSVRRITEAAGHRNRAAIAYHFGDLDGLLHEVWWRRVAVSMRELSRSLDAAEVAGTADDPATLMQMFVAAILASMKQRLPSYWVRFGMRWEPRPDEAYGPSVAEHLAAYSEPEHRDAFTRFFAAVTRLCAGGIEPEASERAMLVTRFAGAAFAVWEEGAESGALALDGIDAYGRRLANLLTAMILAPRMSDEITPLSSR